MIKLLSLSLLFVSCVMANMFNFTEIRYSDSIGRYIEMNGQIEFLKDGLNVSYPKVSKSLEYKNDVLKYMDHSKEIYLGEIQQQQIKSYFDILILLYKNDEKKLKEMFNIIIDAKKMILIPKDNIKNYIAKIELSKQNKQLKSVKLFLKNSDKITIIIDDEIY